MKKSKIFLSILFYVFVTLSGSVVVNAHVSKPTADVNGEMPPNVNNSNADKPPKSKWYRIQSREMICSMIENELGIGKDSPQTFITVGQAARILSYIKWYLYSDHGYRDEFRKNYITEKEMAISLMQSFESRDISEHELATREQLMHLIIHIYDDIKINKNAVDPTVSPDNILNFEEYTDIGMLSECYKKDVAEAIEKGYIYGNNSGELEPKSPVQLNDLVAVSERIIHANIQSHKVLISYKQLQTSWSEINLKYLKIPTYFWNILLKLFESILLNLKLIINIYRTLALKKKKRAYA